MLLPPLRPSSALLRPPPPPSTSILCPLEFHFFSAALQPPSWPTESFVSDHPPRPIYVLLLPDDGLTSSPFQKCNSSYSGRNLFCPPPPPPPPPWPAGFFLSDHCPRPIAVVLFLDHGLPSPAKCNSSTSSPCRPPLLLPVAAAVAVASLILPPIIVPDSSPSSSSRTKA